MIARGLALAAAGFAALAVAGALGGVAFIGLETRLPECAGGAFKDQSRLTYRAPAP